ncbi:MAG: ATP-binding protein [Lachnospiraceae bacterium]|nr:ATP-binding protein [Lachnospiraceae bacterium]MDE6252300.1 ATP-binding protein [Lachnospiraceae bacterium]
MEKKMFRSLIPSMIFMYIASMISILVDGIIIGKYLGVNAMASYGLTNPILLALLAVSDVFTGGVQNVCAEEMGKGNKERAGNIFSASCVTVVVISVVAAVVMNIGIDPLCRMLGASGDGAVLFDGLKGYIRGLSFMIPAMQLSLLFVFIQQLEGNKLTTVVAVVAMTTSNIVLDFLNVLVFKQGMFGMAIATAVSYYLAFFILLTGNFKKSSIFRFNFRNMDFSAMKNVFWIGGAGAVERGCYAVRAVVYNKMLVFAAGSVAVGNMAVAALSVYATLNNFFGSFVFGIESATLMVAGVLYGEENKNGLKRLMRESVKMILVMISVVTVAVILAAPFMASLFAEGAEVRQMSSDCVRIICISMTVAGINGVMKKFLQATRNVMWMNIYSVCEIVVFPLLSALLLGISFGVNGVFSCYMVSELLMLIIFVTGVWIKRKHFPDKAENYLFLPKDFDTIPENLYEKTVCDMDGIKELSRHTVDFCRNHGANERQVTALSLSVKEMAGNIIRYGVMKGKKLNVEYRLVYKNGEFILRLRDDGKSSGQKEWLERLKAEDSQIHRKICKIKDMVKDFKYVNSVNMNCLIIKV